MEMERTYETAIQQLRERQAANQKELKEATERRNSVANFGKKLGFAGGLLQNRTVHSRIRDAVCGMFRK